MPVGQILTIGLIVIPVIIFVVVFATRNIQNAQALEDQMGDVGTTLVDTATSE